MKDPYELKLDLLYSAEYATRQDVLLVLMLAGTVIYYQFITYNILIATRTFRPQVPVALCSTVAMTIGCVVLIPPMGLLGAAWAWIAAVSLESLLWTGLLIGATLKQPRATAA